MNLPLPARTSQNGRDLRKSRHFWLVRGVTVGLAGALSLTGCSVLDAGPGDATSSAQREVAQGTGIWDASRVHDIDVSFDEDAYDAMIATYNDSGDKEWLTAAVTIDGTTYKDAGLRLKGNSSLRGVSASSKAQELPWLIRLDKFVDGQALDGWTEFVVRSNSSGSALNEAVALDLLREAGLASEHAVHSSFSVNGSAKSLRLVVQHLDEAWEEENFSTTGWLYKSEAEGDWTYRGDDPEKYVDVFDQETGADEIAPLADYLEFINESSDADFAARLEDEMDVDSFATYLAFQELINNFDDIDGPGNNSYLRWDAENERFTVVAWDHNLAFGGRPGGAGGAAGSGQGPGGGLGDGAPAQMPEGFTPGERPEGMPEPPEGFTPGERPDGVQPGGARPPGDGTAAQGRRGPGGGNVLATRFAEVDAFTDAVADATSRLQKDLYDSGLAANLLEERVAVLTKGAGDLIVTATVTSDAAAIRAHFTGESAGRSRGPASRAPRVEESTEKAV